MFDFRGSEIGRMPDEDVYKSSGPESQWGITPGMRQAMNQRYAQWDQERNAYSALAGQGGSQVALALANPEEHYRRTGMSIGYDPGGNPFIRYPGFETPQLAQARGGSWLAQQNALRSKEAYESAAQLEGVRREGEAYNAPIASALRQLPRNVAEAVARGQTGYTGVYGDPSAGIPSGFEQKRQLVETEQQPAMAGVQQRAREWTEGEPTREVARTATKRKLDIEEQQNRLESISSQMKSLSVQMQNPLIDDQQKAQIMDRMDELNKQMDEMTGAVRTIREKPTGPQPSALLETARTFNPRKYKGQRAIFRDPDTGERFVLESDGNAWRPVQGGAALIPRQKGGA